MRTVAAIAQSNPIVNQATVEATCNLLQGENIALQSFVSLEAIIADVNDGLRPETAKANIEYFHADCMYKILRCKKAEVMSICDETSGWESFILRVLNESKYVKVVKSTFKDDLVVLDWHGIKMVLDEIDLIIGLSVKKADLYRIFTSTGKLRKKVLKK
jgi:hypothetical protein